MRCEQFPIGALAVLAMSWASSCAPITGSSVPPKTRTGTAHFAALSTYSATLGTPIYGYGTNFPQREDGRLQLAFNGTFYRADGKSFPVHTAVDVKVNTGSELIWDNYGPYGHPFTLRGDDPGTFRGTAGVQTVTKDGTTLTDPSPRMIEFTVLPSLIVRGFTPLTTRCEDQVRRAFGGLPYILAIQSMGFQLNSVNYTVSAPEAGIGDTPLQHTGNTTGTDAVLLQIPQVPANLHAYTLVTRIVAQDEHGKTHELSFGVAVHRPIEVIYTGETSVAEIYTPVVVSGCIPGGDNNSMVSYSENKSETRTRTVQFNWNQGWVRSHSVTNSATIGTTQGFSVTTGMSVTNSQSQSNTNGWSITNGFNVSSTNGRDGSWTVGTSSTDSVKDYSNHTNTGTDSTTDMYGGKVLYYNSDIKDSIAYFFTERPGGGVFPFSENQIKGGYSIVNDAKKQWGDNHSSTQKATAGKSQTINATASATQAHDWSQSLNGSETTTDIHAVTQMASQTKSVSETQSMTNSTTKTQQSGMDQSKDDSDTVSSSDILSNSYSGLVLAGMYGVLYRQTIRIVGIGAIVMYDQCGNGEVVGTVTNEDYKFAPDLGVGPNCPPLPPSNLEPYQCFDLHCSGGPP